MVNDILLELDMELFDFNLQGSFQKWTILHLAGYSGHHKIIDEVLSCGQETIKFPINVFARNSELRTPR
jgi:hypothetical protein